MKKKNLEKAKCSLRGERGAVAKVKPQQLLVSWLTSEVKFKIIN